MEPTSQAEPQSTDSKSDSKTDSESAMQESAQTGSCNPLEQTSLPVFHSNLYGASDDNGTCPEMWGCGCLLILLLVVLIASPLAWMNRHLWLEPNSQIQQLQDSRDSIRHELRELRARLDAASEREEEVQNTINELKNRERELQRVVAISEEDLQVVLSEYKDSYTTLIIVGVAASLVAGIIGWCARRIWDGLCRHMRRRANRQGS